MPKIRRKGIPAALLRHLFDRVREREISEDQLGLLLDWIDVNPEVPHGKWFKRFPEMTVCGEGELIKTFLRLGQIAEGVEVP
jgi:GNAT superfamily N-acetyltransferase